MFFVFTLLFSSLSIAPQAQAGDTCQVGNKTSYAFLVDTYTGSNRTGGNRLLSANTAPSMSFPKGQSLRGRPQGSHDKSFAGTCTADKMYVVQQGSTIVLVPG